MKQIQAVISREKFPKVDAGLRKIGVGGLTLSQEHFRRITISLVVEDRDVRTVVNTIAANATTESAEGGKIFVLPVERTIDIETGHTEDGAALELVRGFVGRN